MPSDSFENHYSPNSFFCCCCCFLNIYERRERRGKEEKEWGEAEGVPTSSGTRRQQAKAARGKRAGGLGGKGEGIKQHKLVVLKYSVVTHSIGRIVNNIVLTMYGVRWALEILGVALCNKVCDCLTTMLYT